MPAGTGHRQYLGRQILFGRGCTLPFRLEPVGRLPGDPGILFRRGDRDRLPYLLYALGQRELRRTGPADSHGCRTLGLEALRIVQLPHAERALENHLQGDPEADGHQVRREIGGRQLRELRRDGVLPLQPAERPGEATAGGIQRHHLLGPEGGGDGEGDKRLAGVFRCTGQSPARQYLRQP